MSATQSGELDSPTLALLAQSIRDVGVVGNDGDRRFTEANARASLHALEAQLSQIGKAIEELAVERASSSHDDMDTLIYDRRCFRVAADAEQAWERDYRSRWHDQVHKSAADWIERLNNLKSQMSAWLKDFGPPRLNITDKPPTLMSEDLMRRFGVGPLLMPVFDIVTQKDRVMRFQPRGLWIIGANGRVDLITKSATRILVDRSKPGSEERDWQLYDTSIRMTSVSLIPETFNDLLRAGLLQASSLRLQNTTL